MFAALNYKTIRDNHDFYQVRQYKSKFLRLNLSLALLLPCTIILFTGQLSSPEAVLNDTRILIGTTAEVGSSEKEGLFDWTSANSVQNTIKNEIWSCADNGLPGLGSMDRNSSESQNLQLK